MNLFIDTTINFTIGILSNEMEFLEVEEVETNKSSQLIHTHLHDLLLKNNLKLSDIDDVFLISGPGSYTGMRVGVGIGQILEAEGHEMFSIRHFDLPRIAGVESGYWIGKAFKKEIFVYEWNGSEKSQKLVSEESLNIESENIYCHHIPDVSFVIDEKKLLTTGKLLRDNASKIFTEMKNKKIKDPIFYYRDEDKEFRPSSK